MRQSSSRLGAALAWAQRRPRPSVTGARVQWIASQREAAMFSSVQPQIAAELDRIRADGLFKPERVILGPQRPDIVVADGEHVLNLCANNYLGLADDSRLIEAAKDALNRWGFGLASVRFICGTQDVHKQLERRLSKFLGTE